MAVVDSRKTRTSAPRSMKKATFSASKLPTAVRAGALQATMATRMGNLRVSNQPRTSQQPTIALLLQQARPFVKTEHAIEILHGDAAGPANEVVFRSQDHDPTAHDTKRDIEEIRISGVLRRGE